LASSFQARVSPASLANPTIAALLIFAVAVATRAAAFGNPVANPDDQFYLLVGDAMWRGEWPYIDLWDRKPFGLFALFALIAKLGNGSILVMQLVALLFAFATAMIIRRIALLFAGAGGATLAGIAYLVTLPMFSGQTAQAPVFFNLLIALGGLALLKSTELGAPSVRRLAIWAMLAAGLAISIKPVAVVEGIFFGLAFLWLLKRKGAAPIALVGTGAVMVLIALLPTALPMIGYAALGDEALDAFVHANFISIFQKSSLGAGAREAGLLYFLLFMGPLLLFAALGLAGKLRAGGRIRDRLLLGWIVAAFGGYLIVPQFYDQYALPLAVPLSIAAAVFFDRKSGVLIVLAYAAFALLAGQIGAWSENRETIETYQRLSRAVDQARHGGCILVNEGPVWLYQSTGACRLTPYIFPGHLNLVTETGSVGIDTVAETRRILALRPAVITFQPNLALRHNPVTEQLVRQAIDDHYQLVATIDPGAPPALANLEVWQRKDLDPPPATTPDLWRSSHAD
jgi:hypothetical protein